MEPVVTLDLARWIVDQLRDRMVEGDECQIVIDPGHGTLTAMINWRSVLSVPLTDDPSAGLAAPN